MDLTKVIGIGLNKTGTKTLQEAMRRLGYRRFLSCRRDLLVQYRNGKVEPALAAVAENDICEDWPYPLMYQELFAHFGKRARYVLTMRTSPEVWLESLKAHSLRTNPFQHCRWHAYGYAYPHGAENEHIAFYKRHHEEVVRFFAEQNASESLLEVCWEQGDEWVKLCSFLELAPPNQPFPHENRAPSRSSALIALANHCLQHGFNFTRRHLHKTCLGPSLDTN